MYSSRAARDMDLLHGPIFPKILSFVLPLMLTNLLQSLYNAADMIIVGLSNVSGAIGAIGTTGAMINIIINLFAGFAVGSSVMVARSIGQGDPERTSLAVHTAMVVGIVTGLATMVLGLLISRPILIALGDEGHILELADLYTRIYFLGVPFTAVTNFLISIFRAKGDTKTPLWVLSATGILNVVLNLLFVLGFGMSVDGVSLATVISNAVSMVVLWIILARDKGWCRLEFRKLGIDRYSLKEIVYNGLPAGLQGAIFSFSNMLIQGTIISINNRLFPGGSEIIDGNAAGANIEGFAYVAMNSVTQATVTFVSQHYGARSTKRMGRVIWNCYLASFIISEAVSLLLLLLRPVIIPLYVSAPAAVDAASVRLEIMFLAYFTLGFMEVGSGVVRGMNRSILSTLVSLIGSCVLRIIWIYTVVKANQTLEMVYIAYPISWTLTAAVHFLVGMSLRKKFKQKYQDQDPEILQPEPRLS